MHPDCPTSGGKDPVLGLARILKELAGSNIVQTMRCCSVLGPTLYLTFQSPAKCVRMIDDYSPQRRIPLSTSLTALFSLTAGFCPWPKSNHLLFLFLDRLEAQQALEAGDGCTTCCGWHSLHTDRSLNCPEGQAERGEASSRVSLVVKAFGVYFLTNSQAYFSPTLLGQLW